MIQKILDAVSDLTGKYTDIVSPEKVLKMLLSIMVVDKVFEITPVEGGARMTQDANVFLNYLNEQLNLYVEEKEVKLFLFSAIAVMYFIEAGKILQSPEFNMLIMSGDDMYDMVRQKIKPDLIEEFRKTELFFKGVKSEKV